MNDFTKEELLILLIDIENNSRIKPSQKIVALTNKLKLMIDHFCDHENDTVGLYTTSGDLPIAFYCYECDRPKKYSKDIE